MKNHLYFICLLLFTCCNPDDDSPTPPDRSDDLSILLIENSPWKIIARTVGDRDDFQLWEYDYTTCGSDEKLYDHTQKMVDGSFNFTRTSLTIASLHEVYKYNCDTGSYDTSEYPDSSSIEWRIDQTTGQLVIFDEEGSWINSLTVMDNKIELVSEFDDEEGGMITLIHILESNDD